MLSTVKTYHLLDVIKIKTNNFIYTRKYNKIENVRWEVALSLLGQMCVLSFFYYIIIYLGVYSFTNIFFSILIN